MNTKQPQSLLLKVFQNKTSAISAELFILILSGVFAAVVQQYLKMPMHLPGKQGILFILILVSTASMSSIRGAGSITAAGAAAYMLIFQFGSVDIFKPLIFIAIGVTLDLLISFWRQMNKPVLFLALSGAIVWTLVPLARIVISSVMGIYYKSFISGLLYPVFTHFLFGFTGALIAALALRKFYK